MNCFVFHWMSLGLEDLIKGCMPRRPPCFFRHAERDLTCCPGMLKRDGRE
jgi:hypothetical protein